MSVTVSSIDTGGFAGTGGIEENFNIPERFKVANFKADIINNSGLADVQLWNLFSYAFQHVKKGLLSIVLFLVLFFLMYILVGLIAIMDGETSCSKTLFVNCSTITFCDMVSDYKDDYNTAISVLTFLIGFYVSSMIHRWWQQKNLLPLIEDLSIHINMLTKPGPGALELKKTLLRHCLLSMSMVYIMISPPIRESFYSPEDLIQKGLAPSGKTSKWLRGNPRKIVKKENVIEHYRERWWQPLVWCGQIIQDNQESFPDGKAFLGEKIRGLRVNLAELAEYTLSPLPPLISKGIDFVYFVTLFYGTVVLQGCPSSYQGFFLAVLRCFVQTAQLSILSIWIHMAEACSSPFDEVSPFDVDLHAELDRNIWAASASLNNENMGQVPVEKSSKTIENIE